MAIIKCPDCGSDVSNAAPACPKCGRPATWTKVERNSKRTSTVTVTISSAVLITLTLIAMIWFIPAFQIGKNLETSCHVDGFGSGSCQFSNTGWTPGSQCVLVKISNHQGSAKESAPICSGNVGPHDTAQRDVTVNLEHICDDADGTPDLKSVCSMDIVDAGDASGWSSSPDTVASQSKAPLSTPARAPTADASSAPTVTAPPSPSSTTGFAKSTQEVQQPKGWNVEYQNASCIVHTDASGGAGTPPMHIKMGYLGGNQLMFIFSASSDKFQGGKIPNGTRAWFVVDGNDFKAIGISIVNDEVIVSAENSIKLQRALHTATTLGFDIQLPGHTEHVNAGNLATLSNISGAVDWLDACNAIGTGALPQ